MYLNRIYDLIEFIKDKFRKKPIEQEFDEYLDLEIPEEPEVPQSVEPDDFTDRLRKSGF